MKFIADEKVLNAILEYLGNRPYIESFKLIDLIRTLPKYEEPETKSEKCGEAKEGE